MSSPGTAVLEYEHGEVILEYVLHGANARCPRDVVLVLTCVVTAVSHAMVKITITIDDFRALVRLHSHTFANGNGSGTFNTANRRRGARTEG